MADEVDFTVLLGEFFRENFMIIAIVLMLVAMFFIYIIKYYRKRKTEVLRRLNTEWRVLTAYAQKVTKNCLLRIMPLTDNEFTVNGDIFLINTYTETRKELVKRKLLDDDITSHLQRVKTDYEYDDEEETTEEITEKIERIDETEDSSEEEEYDDYDNDYIVGQEFIPTSRTVIEESVTRTDTYVNLDYDSQRIVGLRVTGLKTTQNILSIAGFMEVFRFDSSRSNFLFYMIIVLEVVLNGILMLSILTNTEPSFLFETQMWGWYALVGAFFGFYMYMEKALMGHYALCYAYHVTQEEIAFTTASGREVSMTIPVYWIDTYYFPTFRINNVLKVDEDTLVRRINSEMARYITKLTTEVQTYKARIRFQEHLINTKAVELDEMQEEIQKEKAIAYVLGRQDAGARPTNFSPNMPLPQMASGGSELIRSLTPIIITVIVLGAVIVGVKLLSDAISLDGNITLILIIIIGFIALVVVLLVFRAAAESTRRPPIG